MRPAPAKRAVSVGLEFNEEEPHFERGQMRQLRGNNMDEAESALYEMEVDDPAGDFDADYDAIEEDRALDAAGLKDITYQEFMKRADTARRLSEEQDMSDRAAKSFGRRPDKEEM